MRLFIEHFLKFEKERLSQEIKRLIRFLRVFSNEKSSLRLISAILMEVSKEWENDRLYLRMETG